MSNHIDIRYHFIKDHILKGDVELIFVNSELEIADVLTKPLDDTSFIRFLKMLGMFQPGPEFFKNTWCLFGHQDPYELGKVFSHWGKLNF